MYQKNKQTNKKNRGLDALFVNFYSADKVHQNVKLIVLCLRNHPVQMSPVSSTLSSII